MKVFLFAVQDKLTSEDGCKYYYKFLEKHPLPFAIKWIALSLANENNYVSLTTALKILENFNESVAFLFYNIFRGYYAKNGIEPLAKHPAWNKRLIDDHYKHLKSLSGTPLENAEKENAKPMEDTVLRNKISEELYILTSKASEKEYLKKGIETLCMIYVNCQSAMDKLMPLLEERSLILLKKALQKANPEDTSFLNFGLYILYSKSFFNEDDKEWIDKLVDHELLNISALAESIRNEFITLKP